MTDEQELLGITDQNFREWKHHPVTKAVHQYLRDFRQALRRDHTDRWEAGRLDSDIESEARGRCVALLEIVGLEFAHLERFYEEDNAATINQDPDRPI